MVDPISDAIRFPESVARGLDRHRGDLVRVSRGRACFRVYGLDALFRDIRAWVCRLRGRRLGLFGVFHPWLG